MKLGGLLDCKNLLWVSVIAMFLVSATMAMMLTMVNVTSASPETCFYVDPPEVVDVQSGGTFLVTINVTDAPSSYAWEVYLSWDRTLLDVSAIEEGDFLHRWEWDPFEGKWVRLYDTQFTYDPIDEANLKGEILVYCTLIGTPPWASGDGWLFTLNFTVKAEGSTLIDLFDTRLWDHTDATGYPAPTYYPNLDCFFRNVPPPIHDIRITDVTVVPSEVQVGEIASANVTVLNEGTETESFTLYVYADETVIGTTVVSLNGTGNFENRSFTYEVTWNTTGVAGEPYTVSASVPPVSGEVDIADNTFIDNEVTVRWDHDLKIKDITVVTSEVPVGEVASISVRLFNQGNEPENFTLHVYADMDTAEVGDEITIETISGSLSAGAGALYSIHWNTTGVTGGNYTISAFVPPVSGEVDPNIADNTFIDDTVTVHAHDIAITNVTCSPTTATIGEIVSINVTVTNKHYFPETFNITTYYDNVPIEEQTGINLDAGANTTLTFEWNTTYVGADVYTVSAKASEVPNEINTTDNLYTDGNVTVQRLTGWPVANFTYSPEKPLLVNGEAEVTFNSTSYDEDGYIVTWNWDFNGDGFIDATTENATWIYTEARDYVVRLIVNDNDTLTPPQGIEKVITVYAPPVANFTYSPEKPMSDEIVTFNATNSYDLDGDIVSYAWNFGDETPIVELPPPDGVIVTHSYADDGNYTVTLNVTDNHGLSNITSADITVLNRHPVALFSESAETVDTGETITFNAGDSYDLDGDIVSYAWNFGDETPIVELPPPDGVIVTHSYADDGNYTVTLTITDDDGATSSTSATKTVLNRLPVALFTESAENLDIGETVTFNATDSYDPDGVIVSYFWDFGDGTTEIYVGANLTAIVTHSYADDGNYTVTLTITDDDGATSSTSATKTVKAPAGWPLAWYAAISLGIAALVLVAIYILYRRRKPKFLEWEKNLKPNVRHL